MSESFDENFNELLKLKHWNETIFCEKTELDKMMFRRLKRKGHRPILRTVMTVCVAMELNVPTAERLIESAGHHLCKTNDVHLAYYYILEDCKGIDFETCNSILRTHGAGKNDLLGPHTRT